MLATPKVGEKLTITVNRWWWVFVSSWTPFSAFGSTAVYDAKRKIYRLELRFDPGTTAEQENWPSGQFKIMIYADDAEGTRAQLDVKYPII
jgi:hypothetical protein